MRFLKRRWVCSGHCYWRSFLVEEAYEKETTTAQERSRNDPPCVPNTCLEQLSMIIIATGRIQKLVVVFGINGITRLPPSSSQHTLDRRLPWPDSCTADTIVEVEARGQRGVDRWHEGSFYMAHKLDSLNRSCQIQEASNSSWAMSDARTFHFLFIPASAPNYPLVYVSMPGFWGAPAVTRSIRVFPSC